MYDPRFGLDMDREEGLTMRDAFDSDEEYEAALAADDDRCPYCCESPCRCRRIPADADLVSVAGEASETDPLPDFVFAVDTLYGTGGGVVAERGEVLAVISRDLDWSFECLSASGRFFAADATEVSPIPVSAIAPATREALALALASLAQDDGVARGLVSVTATFFIPLDGATLTLEVEEVL
jgi:hypothetical protein